MSKNVTLILSITALGAAYMLNRAANRKLMQMKAVLAQKEQQEYAQRMQARREEAIRNMPMVEEILGKDLCDQIRFHVRDAQRGMGM